MMMMSKMEIRMQNNELEARVIELETELAEAKRAVANVESELEDLGVVHKATEDELEDLHAYVAEQHADDPPERYADWYARLHPIAGSEPDLHVARLPIRIIA